ncbi:4-formylbenzenesulfonate dehydrogenase TsaC1/TsaC2 [Exophiala dermatitidis]
MSGLHEVQTGSGRLAGKVAIVTGAASGFGLAVTQKFVSEGAKVVASDINAAGLEKAFSSSSNYATNVATISANVTSAEDWQKMVDLAVSKFGGLDTVVNNAGTSYKNKPTLEVTEAEFDKVMAVNVKSIFLSVPAVVPALKNRGGGSIINVASIGAMRPRPGLVWYNASKAAVANATKGLAAEFGKEQIRVNALCPLLSGTGLFEMFVGVPYTEENMKKFLFNVPLGRLTDPADVANICSFLASDEGKFITGINLEVDGGRSVGA